jgi:tripartite-type tricarboxylate transporter receptor subunit TctC
MFKDKDFQQDVDKLGWNDELIRGEELNKKVDDSSTMNRRWAFFEKFYNSQP